MPRVPALSRAARSAAAILLAAVCCARPGQTAAGQTTPAPGAAAGRRSLDLARYDAAWADRSPHHEAFVLARGARLEYLEWRDTTRSAAAAANKPVLVLLPGAGQTAHVFDDFAPRFADRFRVVALTPRGVSPSTAADTAASAYSAASRVADLVAALDALGVRRATVAGHSVAGGAMTWLTAQHPERVDRLVYLDATYDYAGRLALPPNPVARPQPGAADTTLAAARRWFATSLYGFWSDALEADLRAAQESRGQAEELRDLARHPAPYARVRAPALVVVARATVRTAYPWLDPVRDAAQVRAAGRYLDGVLGPLDRASLARVRREMPRATVVALESPHHVFIARQDAVVRAARAFLSTDPPR